MPLTNECPPAGSRGACGTKGRGRVESALGGAPRSRWMPPSSTENHLPPGERSELLEEVEKCDAAAESARQAGEHQKLLEQLERGLYLRRRLYSEYSSEVTAACRRLCEVCNCTATVMLQQGNFRGAHELLKRAEQVSERTDLRAITWNNLACYYRRTGKLRTAVTFLERALAIEEHVRNGDAAQTHLNLCASLSQLQRHADALYHAQSALIRLYEILSPQMLTGRLSLPESAGGASGGGASQATLEQVTVLCIAYHNLAVEHEYLKNHEAALCAYAEGVKWASGFLGSGHQLAGILKASADAVKARLMQAGRSADSGALRRAAELMEGFVPGQADEGGGSQAFDHLITPRGDREKGSVDEARDSPSKTMNGTATYSAGNFDEDDADSADGSRSR
eukprot:TRINITY_DN15705_c0_g1_i1.p1 TRINITY_DN15705_c0_g1~~TRINITY_DN15705_c0_g1_i1.p1  ORF type:complete len:395 (-),score=85.41 TRINITY_DN15705_c0_g1_i1:91-1275(-)